MALTLLKKIAERSKKKDDISLEIRNINAGITLAASICSTFINLKSQITLPARKIYELEKEKYVLFINNKDQFNLGNPYRFSMDLQTFTMVSTPIERLSSILYNQISAPARSLMLASELEASINQISLLINERNQLIYEIKQSDLDAERLACLYFGIANNYRHLDQTYFHYMEQINECNDNCLQFSRMLASDLREYGLQVRSSFGENLTKSFPKVIQAKFEDAEKNGLFPEASKYHSWSSSFSFDRPKLPNSFIYYIKITLDLSLPFND